MALPAVDLIHVIQEGIAPSGETWSTGLWWAPTGVATTPTPATVQLLANSASTRFATCWANLKSACSSGTSWGTSEVTYYRAGVLSGKASAVAGPTSGTGSAPQPAYVARCVSLITATAGRSFRGRSYLPWNGGAPQAATGLWLSASATLGFYGAYWNSLGADMSATLGASTCPGVVVSKHLGVATPITQFRMDNKPDTQRGRERSVVPTIFDTYP